jgi:thiol-disulfide isomerase/thioredoxin
MLALPVLLAVLTAEGPHVIEDDFARALETARAQKKLLLVDAWAPWCHTCVYMREHVLRQPGFVPFEQDVVFAAVDTEQAGAVAFLERYPVEVWPTLFFIEPATGAVRFKWAGSADEAQMRALLTAARGAGGALGQADELFARGDDGAAAQRYLAAVGADAGTPSARATLSALTALTLARQPEACARTAVSQRASLASPSERVQGLTLGLGCALELPASPARDAALQALLGPARAWLASAEVAQAMADDVSGLHELLVQERQEARDVPGAKAEAGRWLAYLEGQAAQARTPAARAVFDPHRVSAALAAGAPLRMLGPLQQSERELPLDYNPPARLAVILRELGRLDEALAAADRALGRCTAGPRKLRLYDTKASIFRKRGDARGAQKVIDEELAWARSLPRAQLSERQLRAVEQRLASARK